LHLVNAPTIGKQQKYYKIEKLKKSILHYASLFGTADNILGLAQFKLSLIGGGGGFLFSEDYTCSLGQEILSGIFSTIHVMTYFLCLCWLNVGLVVVVGSVDTIKR
jgi:hypothetical protein